jgi:hypothetical protein
MAACALAAGVCAFLRPTRRLVGPGLLLGLGVAATWGLLASAAFGVGEAGLELGYWVGLVADLTVVLVGGLAGIALARAGRVRLVRRLLAGRLAWLAVFFGVTTALVLLWASVQTYRLAGGSEAGTEAALAFWAAVVAPVVPVCAALLAPRRFGVGVLLGWIGGVTAIFLTVSAVVGGLQSEGSNVDESPTIMLGLALLALLVVTVLLAREAPASEAEPAAPG